MEVSFEEDHICFRRYDFRGATVHPSGMVTPARIRDADWKAVRPEIRTTQGETLFVPHDQAADLEAFCHRHGIARRSRPDTWDDLLEPFLDTSFDPEHERATLERLREAGFPPDEVTRIRRRLTPLMLAYNFDAMVWEWTFLGLFDLLTAANAPIVEPGLQNALGDPVTFYDWTMEVAERHR
ncbi:MULTISPECIES: hypothetical protein [Actinomadura]|uniref:hypothetical protein n=1 Tax=Actinomadura TaxID=1988 RepID=UPI0003AD0407|nr:hypothetical protein [Actinomadura madurae]